MSYLSPGIAPPDSIAAVGRRPLDTTPFRKCAIEFSDAISGRIIVRYLREERRTRMRPRLGSNLLRASGEYPMDSLAWSALSRLHLRTQMRGSDPTPSAL